MKIKIRFFCTLLLLSTVMAFGFTFTATPTSETCSGNGTIAFANSNADPNGTIIYIIYYLPDVTTPFATVNTNFINGLQSGTYRIIAKETVGSVSTQQQLDVVIGNNIIPLVYSVQSLNQACSNTSDISVNIITGVAQSYEIFSGPMHFPAQASNTFSGLPVGVYKIRVYNNCGVGVVQTFTVNQNTAGITIGSPTFSNTAPPSCNFTVATNTLTPALGTVLGYPLSITYTIHPPGGGAAIVITSTLNSGNATSQNLVTTIPDYVNQSFDYDLTIVDACNSTYTQNFPVVKNITLTSTIVVLDCDQNYFNINVGNYMPSFNLNFIAFPVGFNPVAFNSNYPGPYNQDVVPFGDATNIVPFGDYKIGVVDSCGRTATLTFSIVPMPPMPSAVGSNNGCLTNSGNIVVSIPSYTLATAIITVAPAGYPQTLPYDVSSLIDVNGILTLDPLPIGHYEIQITDKCNNVFAPISCDIPVYVNQGLSAVKRPGCDLQKTSIELTGKNGKLTIVSITAAPIAFGHTYPYVISNYITSNGKLYLNDLPGGTYTFLAIDECGFSNTLTVNAPGYVVTTSTFSLQPNCGSFDIPLDFVSNATASESFWLQKQLNATTDAWGHPATNSPYIAGAAPNATNSLALVNNATNFNLSYNGVFRIIREFLSFYDGVSFNNGSVSTVNKECIEILSPTMEFKQSLEILNASRIPCTPSGNLDVVITANGTLPLKYTIESPIFIDNGNSNIFYNLAPGIYTFYVEDNCGNKIPRIYDVSTLLSLVNITQPSSILQCKTTITGNEVFDLTQQNATILGTQSTTEYTLTYYTSLTNAMSATNAIANLTTFNPTTNPQTIYARLIFNALPNCYETASFDLIVGQTPVVNLQSDYLNCSVAPITIDASVGNLLTTTYSWSGDITATTPSVTISQPGANNINVVVTNAYGTQSCNNTKDIVVTVSQLPQFDHIDVVDWTENENSITVYTSNVGDFEYSLDDSTYQSSPEFSILLPGLYTVYVRDRRGCGKNQQTVWLLYYKRYFTPNGDGINETWNIENSQYEPNLKIVIYDRYGKAITSFDANSKGWDGTYSGQLMFATDYWFVVYRQDGRIHKGHFALKR